MLADKIVIEVAVTIVVGCDQSGAVCDHCGEAVTIVEASVPLLGGGDHF